MFLRRNRFAAGASGHRAVLPADARNASERSAELLRLMMRRASITGSKVHQMLPLHQQPDQDSDEDSDVFEDSD